MMDAFPKGNIDPASWDTWSVEMFCRTKESISREGIP
jgi:hypothetical protein